MFRFKNEEQLDPKMRAFVAELISVCEKHGGELSGEFSAYIGQNRLHDISTLDENGVECWGSNFNPTTITEKP